MPLKMGKSQSAISKNISELHKGKTFKNTRNNFGKNKADNQAIAIALKKAGKTSR